MTLPGGIQPQDVLLIATTQVSTSTATTPAGYTAGPSVTSTGTPATTTQLFSRRASGGETSASLSFSSLAQPGIVVAVYRGIDPSTFDAAVHTGASASGTTVGVAGFPTSAIGDQLVMIGGASGNTSAQTWAPPSGLVTRAQTATQTLASAGLFDETLGAPGTVGTQTATLNGTARPLTGILLALKPLALAYDARGNRLTTPVGGGAQAQLVYDQANRLTRDGSSATYTYNGDGLRVEKTVSGSPQHAVWDVAGGLPLLLDDGTSSYVYGPGGAVLEQIADAPTAPITLVGTGGTSGAATSSLPVTLPAGIRANDVILASVTEDGNATVSASGYTVVGTAMTTNPLPSGTTLLIRTATGGETSATITLSSAEPEATVTVAVYRGVDPLNPTGPYDGPGGASTGSGTSTVLGVGTATPTYPGEMLVVAQGAEGFVSASSWTAPSGMREEAVQQSQGLAAGALADQLLPAAGTAQSRTITFGTASSLTGLILALRPAQPVLYYHGDQLQSTRVLTDSAGVVRATFTYDPYGNLVGQTGRQSTPLLFNGQYRDAESGFYYLRARFYDPTTGQFLSRDPLVASTRSPYSYAGGNPVNATDPTGLFCWNPFSSDCEVDLPFGACLNNGNSSCSGSLQENVHKVEGSPFGPLFRADPFLASAFDLTKKVGGEDVSPIQGGLDIFGMVTLGFNKPFLGVLPARIAGPLAGEWPLAVNLWNNRSWLNLLAHIGLNYGERAVQGQGGSRTDCGQSDSPTDVDPGYFIQRG